MLDRYPIYDLLKEQRLDRLEDDGMLRKDWYEHPTIGKCLFKEASPTQSIISDARADWSEKIVWEVANLLNLPAAQYELATGYFDGSNELVEGVLSLNCVPPKSSLLTGEKFLTKVISYNPDNSSQYTIDNVLAALDCAKIEPPSSWQGIPGIDTGAKLFVGYILLDCLVNNSDRHDHNWAVMSVGNQLELVPTYDHGISLGATDADEDKVNCSLSDYVDLYSQSCFQSGFNKLPNLSVFERAAQLYPAATKLWQQQLSSISPDTIVNLFDRLPEGRITPISARFAIDLIQYNRDRLLGLKIQSNIDLGENDKPQKRSRRL